MINKTIKKSVAFTLAAALAFSAAPQMGIAGPYVAEAAEANAYSQTKSFNITTGDKQTVTLESFTAFKARFGGVAKVTATIDDDKVAGIALANDATTWSKEIDLAADATETDKAFFYIKTLKAGTTSIKIEGKDVNNLPVADTAQTINITVSDLVQSVEVKDAEGAAVADGATIGMIEGKDSKGYTVKITNIKDSQGQDIVLAKQTAYDVTGIYVDDDSIADVKNVTAGVVTFTGKKVGSTKAYIYIKEANIRRQFVLNVKADTEFSASIGGEAYTASKAGAWKKADKAISGHPVVYLNNSEKEAKISALASNGKDVTYSAVVTDPVRIIVGNDGTITAKLVDGKVIPGNTSVKINVAENTENGMSAGEAVVDVVITADPVKVVELEVKDDKGVSLGKAAGSFTVNDSTGAVTGAPGSKDLGVVMNLSTKDKTTGSFSVVSNVADNLIDVKADATGAVTVKDGVITAVKKGTATITVEAKVDATAVAPATITFKVNVSDKKIDNVIKADPIFVTKDKKTATIVPTATYSKKFSFPTLARPAVATDSEADQKVGFVDLNKTGENDASLDVILNTLTGEVTYKDNGKSGVAYVKVTGEATDEADAPEAIYVKVAYGDYKKVKSDLTVAASTIKIAAGQSAPAGATSTQVLTYSSDDEKVATVDADGIITGVRAGTALITVSAAENDLNEAGKEIIKVVVSATGTKTNTIKASGKTATVKFVKVKKGAVKLAASKIVKIKNAKGSVSYKKVSGNKKIAIAKNGTVTVKKGLKKGTYTVKVKVTAAGNTVYKAGSKTVKAKIRVK